MKRCCETCRFFEKGTLAGSGWCRHPERVEATSDLVLVRASQLTCRKGWDKDFWEPNVRNNRAVDRFPHGAQLGPVPPASPEDIDAIIKAGKVSDEERTAASSGIGEDRVVGAAPSPVTHVPKSLITKHLPPTPAQAQPGSLTNEGPNTREKILIAKEEVARMRINNRIRPSVEPLPSSAVPPPLSTSAEADRTDPVDDNPELVETTSENLVDTVADDNTAADGNDHSEHEDARQPLPFETRPSLGEWEEPLVPSIPPTFDHWNYPADRHPPFLWLIPGGGSKRSDGGVAPDADHSPSDDIGPRDVVAQSNINADDQPFELPPPVENRFSAAVASPPGKAAGKDAAAIVHVPHPLD